MTPTISTVGLTRRYQAQTALDEVSVNLESDAITGLLGRNGAGKSTFMRVVTGQEFPTSGTVRAFGEDPLENDSVLRRMVFVREDQQFPDFRVKHAIRVASWFYPNWDAEFAETLLDEYELPRSRAIKKLSRGMRSALSIVIGMAARAELTLFDEPYAGLDAGARQHFYDRLLADYGQHPRTILLSTHLIDEAADLLEHVIMFDRGQVTVDSPADDVRGSAVTVSGPTNAVEDFLVGHRVLHRRSIGSRVSAVVAGPLETADKKQAAALHLKLEPLSLQQLMVHTSGTNTTEQGAVA